MLLGTIDPLLLALGFGCALLGRNASNAEARVRGFSTYRQLTN